MGAVSVLQGALMVFCFAKWIELVVLHLAWECWNGSEFCAPPHSWSLASPDGFDSWFRWERCYLFTLWAASCNVALIRPGLWPAHLPPRGRLWVVRVMERGTKIDRRCESLPLGGRWAARAARMRATL